MEQGIYSQDPYFEVSEKMMQINKNPELLSLFLRLLWALTTSHGDEVFWSAGLSATWREELYHPPGEQQTRVSFFFSSMMYSPYWLPRVN